MTDISKLKITRTIQTGTVIFQPIDREDGDYVYMEEEILRRFEEHPFRNLVNFETDDAEFLNFKLSADHEDAGAFCDVAAWLLENMAELGAEVECVL